MMKRTVILSAVLFLLGALNLSAAETEPVVLSTGDGAERLALTFDPSTGKLVRIEFGGAVLADDSGYAFCDVLQCGKDPADHRWLVGGKTEFVELRKIDDRRLVSVQKAGDWLLELDYFLDPDAPRLGRRTRIVWNGDAETKIKGFWSRFPLFHADDESFACAPGVFPPRRITVENAAPKADRPAFFAASSDSPGGQIAATKRPAILALPNGVSIIGYHDDADKNADSATTEVAAKGRGFSVTQTAAIAARMKPGDAQSLGTAWLRFLHGDAETALREVHAEYARIGEVVPADRSEKFERAILYSFHPGGTIGSNCADLGGFTPALRMADRVAELGANAVWIMPIEDRGIYWPRDYYKFQEGLGTGDDYRRLVQTLHDRDLFVLQDIVPHGGANDFPRAKSHPEWLVYDENGKTFYYWCFDFNWPTWRDYMADVARYYVNEYGIDGYRVDACAGSKDNNWNPDIPYARASFARHQAGYNMLSAIRLAVKESKPVEGGILAEVGDQNLGAVADAIYDFTGCYTVFPALLGDRTIGDWVRSLRQWLREKQSGEIKGLIRLRHIESHDSLRSAERYGVPTMRALMAVITLIDGMPLIYHEQEIGNIDAFRSLFSVRRALPELQNGEADYLAPADDEVPDGVFAATRFRDENRSIVLVNLNNEPAAFDLNVPTSEATLLPDGGTAAVVDGKTRIALEPFGWTVLALRKIDFTEPAPIESLEADETAAEVSPEKSADAIGENAPNETATNGTDDFLLSGNNWRAAVDRRTGLLRSMEANGVERIRGALLSLPAQLWKNAESASVREENGAVRVTRPFGGATLELTYRTAENSDGLEIAYRWTAADGAIPTESALLFPMPRADVWSAQTTEGLLRDRLFFRNENAPRGQRHGIYWRPIPLETLFDSFLRPLWGGEKISAEGKIGRTSFLFGDGGGSESALPARVRWLAGDARGETESKNLSFGTESPDEKLLTAEIAMTHPTVPDVSASGVFRIFPDSAVSADSVDSALSQLGGEISQDVRFRPDVGGWVFDNEHYRLRLTRNGAIRSLERKSGEADGEAAERVILRGGELYTDYGVVGDKRRYSHRFDGETFADFRPLAGGDSGAGKIFRLRFEGRLRNDNRFGLMPNPVDFALEYRLDETNKIGVSFSTREGKRPESGRAFLAWMMTAPTVDSFAFLRNGETAQEGKNRELDGRTPESREEESPLDAAVLRAGERAVLRLDFDPNAPATNFFLDRANVFFAVHDGELAETEKTEKTVRWTMSVLP